MSNSTFLASIKAQIRLRHYSYQTEKSYLYWNRCFVRYFNFTAAREMTPLHIEQFLSHLANEKHVSSSTQQQALCALVFAFKHVLVINTEKLHFPYAKAPTRIPQVLSDAEAKKIIHLLLGKYQLVASLLYGSGLRLNEALSIRIKDIDFDKKTLFIYGYSKVNRRIKAICETTVHHMDVMFEPSGKSLRRVDE
jgi:integrase